MKIQKIIFEMGSDFHAIMECEHCGSTQENKSGYHDNYYHVEVIPGMFCEKCGKNRLGDDKPSECVGEPLP